MDDLTKNELDKILEDIKKNNIFYELSDEDRKVVIAKYYEMFRDIIKLLELKIENLVNTNDSVSVIALKDVLTKFISGKKGITHALTEIAYRRAHDKY